MIEPSHQVEIKEEERLFQTTLHNDCKVLRRPRTYLQDESDWHSTYGKKKNKVYSGTYLGSLLKNTWYVFEHTLALKMLIMQQHRIAFHVKKCIPNSSMPIACLDNQTVQTMS